MISENGNYFGEEVFFANHWDNISADQINELVPENFPGKDSFVNFYVAHSGGDFGGDFQCASFSPNDSYRLPEKYQKIEWDVLSFFHIPLPNVEESEGYTISMKKTRDKFYRDSCEEFKPFFSSHIPFANDCADSTFLIYVKSGEIKYLDFDDYFENPNAAFVVASSFADFCKRIYLY